MTDVFGFSMQNLARQRQIFRRREIATKRHSAATPQPMAMTLPFGRNLNASYSPPRRGGVAAPSKKCREATKAAQTGWSVRLAFRRGRRTDHPVRDKSERIHLFDVAD